VLELVLRIGFSLLVVLGLLWVLARVARRPLAGRGGGAIAVLARQQITRGSTVAVVRVADRALIIGVTDGQVTLLGEADPAGLSPAPSPAPVAGRRESMAVAVDPAPAGRLAGSVLSPQTWSQTVQFLRDRTARR
jgi:flagellar protein FliO/FliZ